MTLWNVAEADELCQRALFSNMPVSCTKTINKRIETVRKYVGTMCVSLYDKKS